jgi:hypothetical protein
VPSRRAFLWSGAAALLLGGCGAEERLPRRRGISREDVAVLNEALAFEQLEAGLYAQASEPLLRTLAAQEAEHVATLTRAIRDAGGRPVAAAPVAAGAGPEVALRIEELRAAAFLDQLGRIGNAGLLAVALSMHAAEARQAVALRALTGAGRPAGALGEPLAGAVALERARELLA